MSTYAISAAIALGQQARKGVATRLPWHRPRAWHSVLPLIASPQLFWESDSSEQLLKMRVFMKTVETAVDPQK
jgi:hypothetical protein